MIPHTPGVSKQAKLLQLHWYQNNNTSTPQVSLTDPLLNRRNSTGRKATYGTPSITLRYYLKYYFIYAQLTWDSLSVMKEMLVFVPFLSSFTSLKEVFFVQCIQQIAKHYPVGYLLTKPKTQPAETVSAQWFLVSYLDLNEYSASLRIILQVQSQLLERTLQKKKILLCTEQFQCLQGEDGVMIFMYRTECFAELEYLSASNCVIHSRSSTINNRRLLYTGKLCVPQKSVLVICQRWEDSDTSEHSKLLRAF